MKQKIGLGRVAPGVYGTLKISLKVSVKALDNVPVPGLKAAGTSLLALLKAIEVSIYSIRHESTLMPWS
jgi:hypothetical protein